MFGNTYRGRKLQSLVTGEEKSVLLILLFLVTLNTCGSQELWDIFSGIKFGMMCVSVKRSIQVTLEKHDFELYGFTHIGIFFSNKYYSTTWSCWMVGWIWGNKGPSVSSVQLLSRVQLCNPMDCNTPGFPVFHHLLELAQTHIHWVGDAIQPYSPVVPLSFCLPSFPVTLGLILHLVQGSTLLLSLALNVMTSEENVSWKARRILSLFLHMCT